MTHERGRFLTLEGGEGGGKSTQVRRLADALRGAGRDVVTTREPGGSPGAERLREVLLSGAAEPFGPDAEAVLFAAARADHVDHTIRPALDVGKWVVCDRFMDSTRVYQGAVGKVDVRFLAALERVAAPNLTPDLTFILDVPPEIGLQRAAVRGKGAAADRFEREGLTFHAAVRAAFLDLARSDAGRYVVVDATRPAEQVWQDIRAALEARLGLTLPAQENA
ncbi:dTMP kinase [Aquabacter sp. L1I39]|uniref:dTMP kinase n=1 Tax=Aquabacter sp. L1I39 TaxID=2820278 RepID=UPI001ADD1C2C|nr:dTMP kinase [Aquabacter sp. L1I39]QTL01729.1 dTMP kinase [Aquabacter sp. L1I39]